MSTACEQVEQDQVRDQTGAAVGGSDALSYCHKCTHVDNGGVVASSWRDDRQAGRFDVSLYVGGSLIEVRPHKEDQDALQRASDLRGALREQTRRRKVKVKVADDQDQDQGSRRGKVTVFSHKSRRRLHLLLGKVDASQPCLFLTLTVSDGVDHDGRSMKMYLKRFKARLARKFPVAGLVWRLEPVKRKSGQFLGQAVAHYHGILWGVPDAPGLHKWFEDNWSECVGDRSRVQIEVPRSSKQVMAYCAKLYLSKPGDEVLIENIGRHWGVWNDDRGIPWAVAVVRTLNHGEAMRLLRTLRGWVKASRRSRGRRGKVPYLTKWRAYFVADVGYWADRVGQIVGAVNDPVDLVAGLRVPVTVCAL